MLVPAGERGVTYVAALWNKAQKFENKKFSPMGDYPRP
jgi:hypothetical protein